VYTTTPSGSKVLKSFQFFKASGTLTFRKVLKGRKNSRLPGWPNTT
jgi:hypothetical protein